LDKNIETASIVNSDSSAAKYDIGNYIENKKLMQRYLSEFIRDDEHKNIFAFSVIPGTVNTPANRLLIEKGTSELSESKLQERAGGKERDPLIVGRIIAKMSATRKKFNPENDSYDIDIYNGEIVEISNATYAFEKQLSEETDIT
jgi:hypothetical protein